jgi:hypothetical protein
MLQYSSGPAFEIAQGANPASRTHRAAEILEESVSLQHVDDFFVVGPSTVFERTTRCLSIQPRSDCFSKPHIGHRVILLLLLCNVCLFLFVLDDLVVLVFDIVNHPGLPTLGMKASEGCWFLAHLHHDGRAVERRFVHTHTRAQADAVANYSLVSSITPSKFTSTKCRHDERGERRQYMI